MAAKFLGHKITPSSFKGDPHLQQYFLNRVQPTGKELGRGSYGSVMEVKYQQSFCAAKEIYELLLDSGNEGVAEIIQKYQRECELMASVSHPNLTQFLGLCLLERSRLPLLVMERLEMSLDELLTGAKNISLPLKLSLLHDTCNGLMYLHSRRPPIVHRDLTARNVLISSSMTAKIADFGCSRIIDMRPGQLVRTVSKVPGTLVYMPPEALDDTHRYGPSLDVFSFGHLSLYAMIQEFPGNLLSSTYPDPDNRENILARSEVERRQPYIATLNALMGQSHPVLSEVVRQCLHNAPERRPSSEEILRKLHLVKTEVDKKAWDSSKQKAVDKDQIIQEMMARNSQLEAELKMVRKELEKMSTNPLRNKDSQRKTSGTEKSVKEEQEIIYSLQQGWKHCPDMIFSMSTSIQSVEVDGTLYVGGGKVIKEEDLCKVMTFDVKTNKWHLLPPYTANKFAMTTINNKLVMVGGWDGNNVSQLGVWQSKLKKWTYPFPPMPTARHIPSATSYKNWLVVAGGYDGYKSVSTVEILNVNNMQWSTGPSTPTAWSQFKSTMIDNTWYLVGGHHDRSGIPDVYSVSLHSLVSHSTSESSSIWKKLASLNCTFSSPLSIGGSLFAVGGWDEKNRKPVANIQQYIFATNTWVEAGKMPQAICNCTSINILDKVYVLGGSDGRDAFISMYFCTI